MTAIPLIFRTLLKNWQVGLGYEVQGSKVQRAAQALAPREVLTPER